MGSFYSISVTANGVTTYSFFSLHITSGVITNGGAQYMNPTVAQSTYFNSYVDAIQCQGGPADVTLGAAIDSSDPVTGTIMVSPPANVDTVVRLYGLGKLLGTYTLPAAQGSGNFNFPVSSSDSIPKEQLDAAMNQIFPGRANAPKR